MALVENDTFAQAGEATEKRGPLAEKGGSGKDMRHLQLTVLPYDLM